MTQSASLLTEPAGAVSMPDDRRLFSNSKGFARMQNKDISSPIQQAKQLIDIEIQGLETIKANLTEDFTKAVSLIENLGVGRVIITGMGKSGLIGKKIAATLSSTGTPASFLHPAEGSHGDLGALMRHDVVIAISNSGESPEILGILPLIKRFGVPLIAMTANAQSTLGQYGDYVLNISVPNEGCPLGLAPMASTTATAAMGDALAVALMERRGFSEADFALFHPAGSLGKRLLLRVKELTHMGEELPIATENTSFLEALILMSEKKLGVAIVVDKAGAMLGILTDGDVRRALTRFDDPREIRLLDVLTRNPKTIALEELAVTALRKMQESQITLLVTCDDNNCPLALLHLHDLLKAGLN
jgi:arabinose-5-phosphate isomerase